MIKEILKFIISPIGFIVLPLFIIVGSSFRKYNNFLDIRKIIFKQLSMFKENRLNFIIIYILPIFIAVGITRIRNIDIGIINNINVVLSILIAMFFSIFSIIINFDNKSKNYKLVLEESINTIMFEIVLCVVLLIFTFIYMFIENVNNIIILCGISFIIYYLSIIVLINICIVIKRMYILYENKK